VELFRGSPTARNKAAVSAALGCLAVTNGGEWCHHLPVVVCCVQTLAAGAQFNPMMTWGHPHPWTVLLQHQRMAGSMATTAEGWLQAMAACL
jgi:hypothetical protein